MKEYFKQEWRGMLKAMAVGVIVALVSLAYIEFIGKPITHARNLFNEGVRLYEQKDYQAAQTRFEESNKLWWTAETDNYIKQSHSFFVLTPTP